MSGFAALGDFEGDLDEIVEQRQKQKVEKETAKLKEQAASKLKFEELKAKAGRGAWGDSDDEGDMFASPQVGARPPCPASAAGTTHSSCQASARPRPPRTVRLSTSFADADLC